jgi:cysteinyl-tRNA synthetase
MSLKYLGQPLEIHCGGIDHVPIHHTNEIAQVEAATGKKYCNTWIHGEFLVMDNGKMSKSSGSFITVDTLKEQKIDPLAFRLYCFSSHYRKQLTFSLENVEATAGSLEKLRRLVKSSCSDTPSTDNEAIEKVLEEFYGAIFNDMNMPQALGWLWTMLKDNSINKDIKKAVVTTADEIFALDLFRDDSSNDTIIGGVRFLNSDGRKQEELENIVELIAGRTNARANKDWAKADAIRDELNKKGVTITDGAHGVECSF